MTLAALLVGALATSGFAFTFEPITQTFAPSGRGATQSFLCTNTDNHKIAVKITMVTRDMDENGHETYTSASSQFVVFPSQIVLKAKSSQVIRVQWHGPKQLKVEKNYRIIAEQLPVDFGSEKSSGGNIRILFRYLGAVYVTPQGAKPDVVLESDAAGTGPEGKSGLDLVFHNKGTAHALLNKLTLTVTGTGPDGSAVHLTFKPDQLQGLDGENVLAESTRKFFLPVAHGLPNRNLHVDFSYSQTP